MKIDKIELVRIALPMKKSFRTSFGVIENRETLIVKLYSEDLIGYGESSLLKFPMSEPETLDIGTDLIKKEISGKIIGKDIKSIKEIYKILLPYKKTNPVTVIGIEGAFYHLLAQKENKYLGDYFNSSQEILSAMESIGIFDSTEELLIEIGRFVDLGYKKLKVKIMPDHDIEVIKAIDEKYPSLKLAVDANEAYTVDDIDKLLQLEKYNVEMIEQPFKSEDHETLSLLQSKINIPIALDESIKSLDDAMECIEKKCGQIVNIKPARIGSYYESMKIHDFCQENNISVFIGGRLESGIGKAFNLILSSASNFTLPIDLSSTLEFYDDDIVDPLFNTHNGYYVMEKNETLEFKINETKINKYTVDKIIMNSTIAPTPQKRKSLIDINQDRLVNSFVNLAKIKSPSGKEDEFAQFLNKIFLDMGYKSQFDNYGNLIVRIDGEGEPIVLCAHMDTVAVGSDGPINPQVLADKITSDGTTILGADNKDSIAAIIEAITIIREKNLKNRAIEIIFTKEEEAISRGATNLDLSLIKGKECVISDMAGDYGVITLSAPYCFRYNIKLVGKRAHAKDPEEGINAISVAAKLIEDMPLGKIDKFTTSNLAYQIAGLDGVVNTKGVDFDQIMTANRNTVPDVAILMGEVRGAKIHIVKETLEKIKQAVQTIEKKHGVTAEIDIVKLADGYYFEEDDEIVKKVRQIFINQGIEPRNYHSIGGADANVLNGRGLKSVVVSSAHIDNHQKTECCIIDNLISLADFYVRLITK